MLIESMFRSGLADMVNVLHIGPGINYKLYSRFLSIITIEFANSYHLRFFLSHPKPYSARNPNSIKILPFFPLISRPWELAAANTRSIPLALVILVDQEKKVTEDNLTEEPSYYRLFSPAPHPITMPPLPHITPFKMSQGPVMGMVKVARGGIH